MGVNYFVGWSQSDLERELRSAQEDLASGKSTIAAGAGGASTSSRVEKSCEDRIRMILKALSAIAPEAYPPEDISPANETRIAFS